MRDSTIDWRNWIPYKDGYSMPYTAERVLVKLKNNYVVIASFYFLWWRNDNGSKIENKDVISWMPLPE